MERSFDHFAIARAVALNPEVRDFDAEEWVDNSDNIALTDGSGNYALFTGESPGVVVGHYFFENARGRDAVSLSYVFLDLIFNTYGVKVIIGLTPIQKKGALWLSKHIGFTSYGPVETPRGTCEKFILTEEEYNGRDC